MTTESETLQYKGHLKGHNGWVTCLQIGEEKNEDGEESEFLISGGRDKSLLIWDLDLKGELDEEEECGKPRKMLKGHSHFIQDLCLSQDSRYCLSASWDKTLRLWDLQKGKTTRRFVSHTSDVLTVAFSPENRQIASGARDQTVKIWNTVGECKFTVEQNAHTDWVSAVKFSPDTKNPCVVTAGWDKTIKVWDSQSMQLKNTFVGHTSKINSIAIAAKGTYLASGGADNKAMLWNIQEGVHLKKIDVDSEINVVDFAPMKYWLSVGTKNGVKVWDLPNSEWIFDIKASPIDNLLKKMKRPISCTSLAWNRKGTHLFAGFTDGYIRVYEVVNVE